MRIISCRIHFMFSSAPHFLLKLTKKVRLCHVKAFFANVTYSLRWRQKDRVVVLRLVFNKYSIYSVDYIQCRINEYYGVSCDLSLILCIFDSRSTWDWDWAKLVRERGCRWSWDHMCCTCQPNCGGIHPNHLILLFFKIFLYVYVYLHCTSYLYLS